MAKTTPTEAPDAEKDESATDAPSASDAPPADETPADGKPAGAKPQAAPKDGDNRFFAWIRSIDLPREPGWIGGVCAGLAARLGIDPLIVRGIFVVLAILGAPALLVYAAGWLLLPDRNGQIHAQELGRGHVTPAFPAIVGIALLSLLPLAQGFWYLGGIYWGQPDIVGGFIRAFWTLVVLAAVVVLVVWLARRSSGDVTTAPATTDDRPDTIPDLPVDEAPARSAAATTATGPTLVLAENGEPIEPAAPPADASAEELAAWKASQAEWQKQRAAWVAEQARAETERAIADRRARNAAAAAAAAERRRIQKIVRPRVSGAAVAIVIGLALVVGAVSAFVASTWPATQDSVWAIGIAASTTVVGLSAIVVGFARRRSGFLAFLGILGVTATLFTLLVPQDVRLLPPSTNYGIDAAEDGSYIQLAGTTSMWIDPDQKVGGPARIDIWQASGDVEINLMNNAALRIEATVADGGAPILALWGDDPDYQEYGGVAATGFLRQTDETDGGDQIYSALIGEGEVDVVLHLWLGSGQVRINSYGRGSEPFLDIAPPPTDVVVHDDPRSNPDFPYEPFPTGGSF